MRTVSTELKVRVKSFLWTLGWVGLASVVDYTIAQMGVFNLSPVAVVVIGSALNQLSKYAHNKNKGKVE